MAAITQLGPTSDSINGEATGFYVNQLNVAVVGQSTPNAGLILPLAFITLVHTTALSVAANGAVNTTGTLENGTFSCSGTISDSVGNNGTWSFTLTVVGIPSPQVALVPKVPLLPTGVEIAVPFQIDPATGGVAYLNEYSQIIAQHVETIVMTALTERVMIPKYGSTLPTAVFRPITGNNDGILAKDIQDAIISWEPAVKVAKVTVVPADTSSSQLNVTVTYTIVPFNDVNTVSVITGGTISQVSAP